MLVDRVFLFPFSFLFLWQSENVEIILEKLTLELPQKLTLGGPRVFAELLCVLFDIYYIRRSGVITLHFLLSLPRPSVPGSAPEPGEQDPSAGRSSGINDHPVKGRADGSSVGASAVASPSLVEPRHLEIEAAGL